MRELELALRQALKNADHALADCELQTLVDKGLAHTHVRLLGSGWLARIPKQSQMGLSAEHNLAYQLACFERAAVGGHTPGLRGVLPPSLSLPRGALLVEEIVGRAAQLPGDLPAIAQALASVHALPLPHPNERAPLLDAEDPLQALWEDIATQAVHLRAARVGETVVKAIEGQMKLLQDLVEAAPRPQRHLIAFDGHPGNFIVRPDGTAVLVDLEKCRYSYPGLDLAHATLYTSTTWDVDTHAVLGLDDVVGAYQAWANAMGAASIDAEPWHVPLRRAMWLWSITWCAKWRVLSAERSHDSADGEDWSAQSSERALIEHVRGRVDHYLSASVVGGVLSELGALERELKA